jgi:predicted AlkP superfamily pyrophosphatase or phosphodiesterase
MNNLFRSTRLILLTALLVFTSTVQPALLSSAQTEPAQAQHARRDAHVIMISIDGLVPDYYTAPAQLGLKVPNLTKMKLGGAYAEGVEGIFPTVTYPAHTTIITGVHPAIHGILQNRPFEAPTAPQTQEWYWFADAVKTETLWSIAKQSGLVTASVGWPVTVGANIDYNVPEIFDPKENPPTGKRTAQYATPGLLQNALAGGSGGDNSTDGRRTTISEFVINTYKPNLMLIHLVALDDAHHKNGPRTPAAIETTERMDGYVGRIIEAARKAGIFDQTTFFLVSDHGFARVTQKFEPGVLLVKEKLITLGADGKPTDWKAAAWSASGSCAIVLHDPNDKETAKKVTEIFGRIASSKGPIDRLISQAELKKLGSVPTAVLMLDASPDFAFGDELTGPATHDSKDYRGTHGQLPSRAEMRSALIVYGASARVGAKLTLARMIDIGPTAAAVLGLSFANAEGTPIAELLKAGVIPAQPRKKKDKRAKSAGL